MNLPRIAVNRPVTILMVLSVGFLLGLIALQDIPLELLPDIDLPVAVVQTHYEGAGPETIESLITQPLEEGLQMVRNVENITSFSQEGESMIIIEFQWGTDLNNVLPAVRQQMDRVGTLLPDDAEDPYTIEYDPTQIPILEYGLTGELTLAELQEVVDDAIVPRLERISGIASVEVRGGPEREIQVHLDPGFMRMYGISISSVVDSIHASNMEYPAGDITIDGEKQFLMRTVGLLESLEEIEEVMIPGNEGVYSLGDMATIEEGFSDQTMYTRMDGEESLGLSLQKEGDANTVEAAEGVKEELEAIQAEMDHDIQISTISDQSEYVQLAINAVVQNAVMGGLLAIVVLFLFLGSFTTTLIIAVAIPISIITTFFFMFNVDMTLNIMALGGLALGIGMLVDNAIVVLESNFRHWSEGAEVGDAAVGGTREVMGAISASTLTTLMVFLPVVFIEGIASQIFRDLSFTVTFALLVSLLVSVTAIPVLFSRWMGRISREEVQKKQAENRVGRILEFLRNHYSRFLRVCLKFRWASLLMALCILLTAVFLFASVGTEFLPALDEGQIQIQIEMPRGTAHAQTDEVVTALEEGLQGIPEVKTYQTTVGIGRMGDEAEVNVSLIELEERERSTEEVMEEIRSFTETLPQAQISVSALSTLMGGGLGEAPVQVNLMGEDLEELGRFSREVKEVMAEVPGIRDVEVELDEERPEMQIHVNKRKAGTYGLTSAGIANEVRMAISGQVASRYEGQGEEEIDIVARFQAEDRENLSSIEAMPLSLPDGHTVPLHEVGYLKEGKSPVEIQRVERSRTIPVSAEIHGVALGNVLEGVEEKLQGLTFPADVEYQFGGEVEWMDDAFNDLYMALALGAVLVFMILAAQFESLWQPFVLMFSLPFALVGALWALYITGWTLNVASLIGMIMLMGIVVNNAIVFLDFINQLQAKDMKRLDAILEAGRIRLRPILMTSLTTILAMFPLALGIGEGAELQAPIAVVVIGGLVVATLATLIMIPVLYTLFDDGVQCLVRGRKVLKKIVL